MKRKNIFTVILFFVLFSFSQAQDVIQKGNLYYQSNTIIIKVKENSSAALQRLNNSLSQFSVGSLKPLVEKTPSLYKGEEPLSRIYTLIYNSNENPEIVAKKIAKQPNIEWAEPKYVHRVTVVPNDSLYQTQTNLKRVFAEEAWNITKGDTSVIIGIVDTGVDWNHPDLKANVAFDKNGKLIGTDLGGLDGTPDNDPTEDPATSKNLNAYHGTHVAGIADAVTDNKIGVASIGYNCTIIPVKVSRSDKRDSNGYPYVYYGYEGIKYAADKGAKVINCSWGGYGFSRYEQEVINYAISKGVLIVAAAGNEGKTDPFYPASYKGVLSVGWLETDTDLKAQQANYGRTVKVFSPGTFINSTWQRAAGEKESYNTYMSGSSMAAPLVSGLAGLVYTKFPNYNPLQVEEQIRVTADNIEPANPSIPKYMLGKGRINALRAVSTANTISVRAKDVKFIDDGNKNGLLETGETISVEINFLNYLSAVSNVAVTFECNDQAIQVINSSYQISSMNMLDSINNAASKFQFRILPGAPFDHDIYILLKFSAAGYSDFQWLTARINPTYDTHSIGKITTSITSRGALGFNDYPNNLEGEGFKFENGETLLFEGAFMYGTAANRVMDAARVTDKQSSDFMTILPIKIDNTDNTVQHSFTIFNDSGAADTTRLGIETRLNAYTFANPPDDSYVLLVAELQNTTQKNINGLYTGYFFDWDMPADNATIDSTAYNSTDNFGFALCKNPNLVNAVAGAALVSSDKYGFYPINNAATTGDVRLFDADGFTDKEKWISLSSGTIKTGVGPADISFVISGGPFNIPAGQSIKVGFAIAAAANMNDLGSAIRQSRIKYKSIVTSVKEEEKIPAEFVLNQNYPNPFNPSTTIKYSIPVVETRHASSLHVSLKIYDILGREVATLVNEEKQPGNYMVEFNGKSVGGTPLPSGVYFYRLVTDTFSETKKMLLIK